MAVFEDLSMSKAHSDWLQGTGAAFDAGGLRVGQVILQVDGVTTLGRPSNGSLN